MICRDRCRRILGGLVVCLVSHLAWTEITVAQVPPPPPPPPLFTSGTITSTMQLVNNEETTVYFQTGDDLEVNVAATGNVAANADHQVYIFRLRVRLINNYTHEQTAEASVITDVLKGGFEVLGLTLVAQVESPLPYSYTVEITFTSNENGETLLGTQYLLFVTD